MPSDSQEVTILLVEDDPGHAKLIVRNLRRAGIVNDLEIATTGQAALDYVFSQGDCAGQQRASTLLVLLDLNLPGVDGYEVLRRMKIDPYAKTIPVIILTSTDDDREVARCYELGCNVYITKPIGYDALCNAVRNIGLLLSVVTIPGHK